MVRVGVRELRQSASELLRRVEQGETFEITDRGRPVALLAPLPNGGPLEQRRSTGQVDEASGDIDELPEPIAPPAGVEAPSRRLAGLRRAER
jgi:prevent-host-death family protein